MSKLQEVQRVSTVKTVWLVILSIALVGTLAICLGVIGSMSENQEKYDYLVDNACSMKYGADPKDSDKRKLKTLKEICVTKTTPWIKSLNAKDFKKHVDDMAKQTDVMSKGEQAKEGLDALYNIVNTLPPTK